MPEQDIDISEVKMPDGTTGAQNTPIIVAGAQDPSPATASTRFTSFEEAVKQAVISLVQLRVTTIVGTASAKFAGSLADVTEIDVEAADQAVACTTINTALGDCTLIQSPIFITDASYKALHEDAVKSAIAIRADTIALLKDAWAAFEKLLKP
jgi:hypothetical protein